MTQHAGGLLMYKQNIMNRPFDRKSEEIIFMRFYDELLDAAVNNMSSSLTFKGLRMKIKSQVLTILCCLEATPSLLTPAVNLESIFSDSWL